MKLTITQKDQARAGDYYDNDNCLVATMLKHRGKKNVRALAFNVYASGIEFSIVNYRDINRKFYGTALLAVRKSAIGKKIELVEV